MRLGVLADVHGNDVALRAVLRDAGELGVDQWWVVGDLVLFGPRPVEVLAALSDLPGVQMLRGNTDRYVLTGEQPAPHQTAADAIASVDLVQRYGDMAAGTAWTRGVLDQGGMLSTLASLPAHLRVELPSGVTVLGVHASPQADDGQGIAPETSEDQLRLLLAGCGADVVIGGHTHRSTDRLVDGIRAINPGSVGMPRVPGIAEWALIEDDGDGLALSHRAVTFDVSAVVHDLRRRNHPNKEFVDSILTGQRPQITEAAGEQET